MDRAKKKVLLIDDDKFLHRIVDNMLSNFFDIIHADNGLDGIALAKQQQPKAILLDVEMPGKNGYETCELLKTTPETAEIPVIFISGNDSLREKMLGFEVGAEDYLIKPFEAEILKVKLSLIIHNVNAQHELDKQAREAEKVAFAAMSTSAELGRIIRFVEHTHSVDTIDALAQSVFKTMTDFGLKTTLCFLPLLDDAELLFYTYNSDTVSPLECDVLTKMHTQGRIVDFGCRTFINFRNVSLLIKNMPLDDMDRYGRIKDAIPFVLGAVDGKIRNLFMHNLMEKQAKALVKSVDSIGSTLAQAASQFRSSQDVIRENLAGVLLNLDTHLGQLGLEADQEQYLVKMIETAFNETLKQVEQSLSVSDSLVAIGRLLTHLAAQQQTMVEKTKNTAENAAEAALQESESYSSDFELF